VCTEAFHFFDQPRALREFHRVLEPEGHLIVAVITPAIPTLRFTAGRAASWPTRGQMREMMRSAGFRVESQRPVRPLLGPLSPGVATVGSREGG
jgi:predicted SAM-dependent methyltransferase